MNPVRVSSSIRVLSFIAASLALPAMAHAIPVPIAGTGEFGSFEGFFDVSGTTVTVTLTNTSDPANGGYITAFAFNLPGDDTPATATLVPGDFEQIGGTPDDSINGAPYGTFDVGAANPGSNGTVSWLGGGNPTGGIAVGETEVFEFTLGGPAGPTAETFMNTFNDDGYAFAVRFKGFEDGESDKVIGTVVPEPGTLLLLGGGLTALALRRRRSVH